MDNYRIVSSDTIDGLQEQIESVSREGYILDKFNDNGNPDNWQGIAIMKKVEQTYGV